MKYRLLALDLDGTLFDSSSDIPQANRLAVRRALASGMLVVLCTGRSLNEARAAVEQLDHRGPLVLANGSLVCDPTTSQTLHRAQIEPHLALEIVQYLDDGPDAVLVLTDPQPTGLDYLITSAHQITENTRWWLANIHARTRQIHAQHLTADDLHHALRVGIVGPSGRISQVAQAVRQHFGSHVFVQHFGAVKQQDKKEEDVHILEVFANGVSKWAGLKWVAQSHAIQPDQIAAIGDEINDLELIDLAGCGIAMANAAPSLLQVADYQTLTNNQCGVAHAINQLLTGKW